MVLSLCSDVLDHSGPTLDLRGCTRSNSGYHGIHRSCKTAEMKSLPLPFQIQCTTMSESAPQWETIRSRRLSKFIFSKILLVDWAMSKPYNIKKSRFSLPVGIGQHRALTWNNATIVWGGFNSEEDTLWYSLTFRGIGSRRWPVGTYQSCKCKWDLATLPRWSMIKCMSSASTATIEFEQPSTLWISILGFGQLLPQMALSHH